MNRVVLLDAGPLGMASNPRPAEAILAWLGRLLTADVEVLVPEIADYEVRRELLSGNAFRWEGGDRHLQSSTPHPFCPRRELARH